MTSLLAPFAAYLPAEAARAERRARGRDRRDHRRPAGGPGPVARTPGSSGWGSWGVLIFFINGFAFLLIGVQLPSDPRPAHPFAPAPAAVARARDQRDRRSWPGSPGSSRRPTCRAGSARSSGSATRAAARRRLRRLLGRDARRRHRWRRRSRCRSTSRIARCSSTWPCASSWRRSSGQGLTLPWVVRRLGVVSGFDLEVEAGRPPGLDAGIAARDRRLEAFAARPQVPRPPRRSSRTCPGGARPRGGRPRRRRARRRSSTGRPGPARAPGDPASLVRRPAATRSSGSATTGSSATTSLRGLVERELSILECRSRRRRLDRRGWPPPGRSGGASTGRPEGTC